MRGVDRHTHPRQLILVNFIAAALRQSFDQPNHFNAGLQGVVTGNQAQHCRRRR